MYTTSVNIPFFGVDCFASIFYGSTLWNLECTECVVYSTVHNIKPFNKRYTDINDLKTPYQRVEPCGLYWLEYNLYII